MSLNRNIRTRVTAAALAWSVIGIRPAFAQDPQADIARELAALRAEVRQLRAEVDALKSAAGPGIATPASIEMLQSQVAELAQEKVESDSKLPVKLFATVHGGLFTNSGNVNWLDNPNLVGAPPADGQAGTLSASLRQTRIGFAADGPGVGGLRTNAVVAMDFFGSIPTPQTGQMVGLPRLVVAFARIEGERTAVEVGQDYMILAPRDPTSLAAYAFPLLYRSGNLYLRVPQVRVEHALTPHLRATAGLLAPIGGDLTGDSYVFVPPAVGAARSRRPGLQARIAYKPAATETRVLDVGLSGHLGWERQGNDLARSWATAVDVAARRNVVGLSGELFVGDNMDAFGGGLGLDARSAGGWGEVKLFPSERLSLAAGLGLDDIRDARRFELPRQRNRSAFGSVIFSITPEVQTSFEYRLLGTQTGSGERTNHHFDWVFVHKF